ncbi:MAG: hypothetical protein AAFX01_01425 [Cyanobacteria bacterium J06638_28]
MLRLSQYLLIGGLWAIASCSTQPTPSPETPQTTTPVAPSETVSSATANDEAQVTAVTASGEPDAYTFAVTVQSTETGCDQYANWWEVVTPEGELIYRRILVHSHVDEQPFRRTGGPVIIQPETAVIVRAHMDPQGYGTQAMQGSVAGGFEDVTLPEGFAADLATAEPQPGRCTF